MSALAASVAIWAVWAVSWALAAVWSSRAAARPPLGSSALYAAFTAGGFLLLFTAANRRMGAMPVGFDTPTLWDLPAPAAWAMTVVVACGFVFAWWARIHLGALWSGTVTRKAGHRVVDTGPYRLVRHPIYTGLILGAVALALQAGRVAGLGGAALLTVGFWIKARLEEGFLRAELGADYDAYAARTPMLLPFLGPRR